MEKYVICPRVQYDNLTQLSNMNMRFFSVILSVFLCPLLVGCGDGTLRINGTVTFPDGSPLTQGTVAFATGSFSTSGTLDASGRYSVNVPPGQYKVYIALASVFDETFVAPPDEPDAVRYIPLIHPSFGALETTPLICDITKSGSQNFVVEPPVN